MVPKYCGKWGGSSGKDLTVVRMHSVAWTQYFKLHYYYHFSSWGCCHNYFPADGCPFWRNRIIFPKDKRNSCKGELVNRMRSLRLFNSVSLSSFNKLVQTRLPQYSNPCKLETLLTKTPQFNWFPLTANSTMKNVNPFLTFVHETLPIARVK